MQISTKSKWNKRNKMKVYVCHYIVRDEQSQIHETGVLDKAFPIEKDALNFGEKAICEKYAELELEKSYNRQEVEDCIYFSYSVNDVYSRDYESIKGQSKEVILMVIETILDFSISL